MRILRWMPILALALVASAPMAAASTTIVGAGLLTGELTGDLPIGDVDVALRIGDDYGGVRPFTFSMAWPLGEQPQGQVWPYDLLRSPYLEVERVLEAQGQEARARPLSRYGPVFVFFSENHTVANPKLEGQSPTLFFRVEAREVAMSYHPPWPVAVVWCEPACGNLRSSISDALMGLARNRASVEAQTTELHSRVGRLEMESHQVDTVSEVALRQEELEAARSLAWEREAALRGQPHTFDALWRYPLEMQQPLKDAEARLRQDHEPSMSQVNVRLDTVEARLERAKESAVYVEQEEYNRQSLDATARDTRIAAWALVALLVMEGLKWLFPESGPLRQRVKHLLRRGAGP